MLLPGRKSRPVTIAPAAHCPGWGKGENADAAISWPYVTTKSSRRRFRGFMIKLAILGATGSIGTNTLDLAEKFPDKIKIVSLSCGRNVERLAGQIRQFQPKIAAVADAEAAGRLRTILADMGLSPRPQILWGPEGLSTAATEAGADTVLSAIVGEAGLVPTWASVRAGLQVALANKESLVLGGELLMPLAKKTGSEIVPVDSEHSAIFQVMEGRRAEDLHRIILTASGGPFRGMTSEDLESVCLDNALQHPRWSMGPKITCDSATMMNKGLEVIEAHHLFGVNYDQIEVLVHPQSVVHSLVEFIDGSQLMQAGPTDMRLVIAYALSHPYRWPLLPDGGRGGLTNLKALDLAGLAFNQWRGHLTFEEPDRRTFRALALAEQVGRIGGTAPAIMSSANEEAVNLFLSGAICFADIIRVVERTMEAATIKALNSIDEALEAAAEGRRLAKGFSLDFIR